MTVLPAKQEQGRLKQSLIEAHNQAPGRVYEDRVRAALTFLDALPDTAMAPIMSIAIDGELFFLWEQGHKCLAIVPQVDGRLRYSAHFGREKRTGCDRFSFPCLPGHIARLINAFKRCDA